MLKTKNKKACVVKKIGPRTQNMILIHSIVNVKIGGIDMTI